MNAFIALSLFLAAFIQQGTTGAAPAAASAAASSGRPARDPNEMICRRYRESGSRIVIRQTCMTREQWAEFNRELRANVDHAQMTRVLAR